MSYPATGSPAQAFVTGVRSILTGDATLMALVTGVYGHVSEAAKVAYPYLVLSRRSRSGEAGAMQTAGSMVTVQLDVWHGRNPTATTNTVGPATVHAVLQRASVLLERRPVTVTGFQLIDGSVTCEFEEVFDEPDDDAPEQRLYHGVQRWVAEVHDA